MALPLSLSVPLVGLALVASTVATLVVARRLAAPTAKPLLGVCVFLLATVVSQAIVLVPSPLRRALQTATGVVLPGDYWLVVVLALTLPACGLWLLFAIQHTGRGDRLRRQVAVVLVAVIGLCYGAAIVAGLSDGGGSGVSSLTGVLASGLFFTSPFASLGALLIVETALRRNALPFGEAALLAGGSLLFIYGPVVAFNLDRPLAVPVSVCGAASLLAITVRRYPVFETLPGARITARDRLVEEIDDAVTLIDQRGRVVDLNVAAESLLDLDATSVDRRRLDEVVPACPAVTELAAASGPTTIRRGQTALEVVANPVHDERQIPVGYLVVWRDVTERRRRERRLRLLTQFLTETVGERTATVAELARRLARTDERADDTEGATASGVPAEIRDTTDSLARLVGATRRVERALSGHETGPCDLGAVLQRRVAERDGVTSHVDRAAESETGPTVAADPSVVDAVVELLVEEQLAQHPEGLELHLGPSGESGSTIELTPASTRRDAGHGPEAESGASTSAAVDAPTIELSRLALEHAGGSVEQHADGSVAVVFEGPASRAAALTGTPGEAGPADETQATDASGGGAGE